MYRQGLGDCFLITFQTGDKKAFHAVIDCGVLRGGKERLTKVVADIATRTSGRVDLLIATHEHADHLSGFNSARDLWEEKITVKQTWLGWTENESDPAVKALKNGQKLRLLAALLDEHRSPAPQGIVHQHETRHGANECGLLVPRQLQPGVVLVCNGGKPDAAIGPE